MQEGTYKKIANVVKNDLSETTPYNGPCYVERIVINAIGTACVFSLKDDTAVKITGTLANTELPHFADVGLNIETSLKVEMSGTAAGNVLIIYRTP